MTDPTPSTDASKMKRPRRPDGSFLPGDADLLALFESRIVRGPEDECWRWGGFIGPQGYGMCNKTRAHRLSYEVHVGPIPRGHVVMHLCNNKSCVNPKHLKTGTQQENTRAAIRDGLFRLPPVKPRGSQHGHAKLNEEKARVIHALVSEGRTRAEVARLFGVSRDAVSLIVNGVTWSVAFEVPDEEAALRAEVERLRAENAELRAKVSDAGWSLTP